MNPFDVVENKRHLEGMAELLAHYIAALEKEGFSHAEAVMFARDWQASLFSGGTKSDSE